LSITSPESPLSPQAWCRRVLTALNQHAPEGPEAGSLGMLLAYFIELNPSAETFDELLQQYCADARPGIADAAALLLRSWQRRHPGASTKANPRPLRELLRTLGALLDESRPPGAYLRLEADGVLLQPFGETARRFTTAGLQQEAVRRAVSPEQMPQLAQAPAGFVQALSTVATVLEPSGVEAPVEVIVTARTVVVESPVLHRVFVLSPPDAWHELSIPALGSGVSREPR